MDVIVKGQPSIEVKMEAKVVDSYKTADAALSESSVNPVQNKVITAELGKKATKTELSALDTKVTENKTATDTAVSDLSTKVDEAVEGLNEGLAEQEKSIADLDKTKADTTGYYPQLSVGLADNLPDRGDVNEGLIGFRESAGAGNSIEDGAANVVELLGESLVWNQQRSDDAFSASERSGVSLSLDGQYVVLNGTATANVSFAVTKKSSVIKGHKYLIVGGKVEGATYNFYDTDLIGTTGVSNAIFTALESGVVLAQRIYCANGRTYNNYRLVPRLHDLTLMFEAGKEPSTIEEFEARTSQLVGVDFNAYNEGEVLGVNIKGIKSVNDNAFNGEYAKVLGGREYCADGTITSLRFAKEIGGATEAILLDSENKFTPSENGYVYASGTDICIHLVHTGYKDHVYTAHEVSESSFDLTPYFPNGMHGINGVRDSVTKSKAKRRFGVVDMGTLNWSAFTTMNGLSRTSATISGFIGGQGAEKSNILCAKFVTIVANTSMAGNEELGIFGYTNNRIFVLFKEGDYTDTASFKAAMAGVPLIYELATPIETEIDPQLNMNYKVWDFGTEELLTDSKSAPVLARTIYGFNATDTIRGNKAKNEEQDVRFGEIERTMVQKEDYAPALTSGFADNLVGSDVIVDKDFTIRKSGDGAILDGAARMEVVKGNSVVWNQYVDTSRFTRLVSNGVHFEKQADGGINVYTDEGGATADTTFGYLPTNKGFLGHYCAILGCPQGGSATSYYLNDGSEGFLDMGVGRIRQKTSNNMAVTIGVKQGTIITTPIVFYPKFIDLTQMFGAGNEPTTIEEFYARKPIVEDEYAYNEGEVIHCNVDSVKSVGRNVWDEEWELGSLNSIGGLKADNTRIRPKNFTRVIPNETYYFNLVFTYGIYFYDSNKNYVTTLYGSNKNLQIPSNVMYLKFNFPTGYGTTYNHDICINLSDPDFNGKYEPYKEDIKEIPTAIKEAFPEGMMSAGTAHDVAYNDMNKEVGVTEKRIGVVDMGTLSWSYSAVSDVYPLGFFRTTVANKAAGNNILSSLYPVAADWTTRGIRGGDSLSTFYVKDSSYTDAATFKEAMQGVMLYYELAEPIVTEHDEPFNLDYQVANGGQEQAMATEPTSAFKAKIAYGFNAAAKIKENANEIENLKAIITQLQAAIASMVNANVEDYE